MLKDNEYFTKLTTCYCKKPYGAVRVTRLCGVRFTTNQNNQLSINMGQGSQYDYSRNTCYDFSKEGSAIVALHGMYKDGGEMTYLAPYYASMSSINNKLNETQQEATQIEQEYTPASNEQNAINNNQQTIQPDPKCMTDLPPPGQYSCQQQKDWGKCGEPWMVGKCNQTCGKCD